MICEECGGTVIMDEARAELVCGGCGIVVQERIIDTSPDLSVSSDSVRTTAVTSPRMEYLKKVDSRIISNKERSERRLKSAVHDLARRAGASTDVEKRALTVAYKVVVSGKFRGWPFGIVAGGATYFAMMEANGIVERTFLTAVQSSSESTRESNVLAVYKSIKKMTGVLLVSAPAEDIARLVVQRLGLSDEVLRLVKQTLKVMPKSAIPRIDAAAGLYRACTIAGVKLSQRRIAQECGTNDVSLRGRLAGGL